MPAKNKKTVNKKKKAPWRPKSGLDGYLVVWRHTMDDVPVGLFANKEEALKVAKTMSFKSGYNTAGRLGIDCSTPICFVVVPFVRGAAQEIAHVQRTDD